MRPHLKYAATLVAGLALGLTGADVIRAQSKPPAFHVGVAEVSDRDGYAKEFIPIADKITREHGGVFVVRGAPPEEMDGQPPKGRVVILQFENMDKLHAWHKAMEPAAAVRAKYAKLQGYAVEGTQK